MKHIFQYMRLHCYIFWSTANVLHINHEHFLKYIFSFFTADFKREVSSQVQTFTQLVHREVKQCNALY